MKKILIGLLVFGFAFQSFAQIRTEKLSEVVIAATNYKYLNKVGLENADVNVSMLEQKVASFDLKNAEFYRDEYDTYAVDFYIPDGKILVAYDKDGNIIRTIEKFNDVALPREVIESVAKQYPNWTFKKDVYLVNYHESGNISKKYKIVLENNDKRIRIKVDAEGNFL
ncbi:nicotinate-nucleotide adenylyltransferase [uncultured Lutibacter sp.]|uniref:nicotinate-nucleotide adenylyltransferase n=1 Tax=uncultured Lutibacter sp. TaxID=437739 RepID=UPI0026342116|nr:nicotinate-nucleotide adenylyltransferase [uncultured Lutibacter sp.]